MHTLVRVPGPLRVFFVLAVVSCAILLLGGCGGDGGGAGPSGGTEVAAINRAADLQEDCYSLLEDLLAVTDTASAVDSVVKVFRADSTVAVADTNSQGIYVEYTSGMRGGIILNYEEEPGGTGPSPLDGLNRTSADGRGRAGGSRILGSVPADKRTIILNPHYYERAEYTDLLVETYDERFPMAGFWEPEIYYNDDCTLEKFTFLEHYGIIHFYSHGWAWPRESYIATVYMMTGETVNERTTNTYWRDIVEGDVPLVIGRHGHKYFVSPEFVTKWNNFEQDTTLIYGGFCYSFLGGWPAAMNDAGAGGYFGFNWSVWTNWNSGWALSLFAELTDTLRMYPMTALAWMDETPYIEKLYVDDEAPEGFVGINYYGLTDLTLFRTKVRVDLRPINDLNVDLMATIDWDCTSPRSNLSIHKVTPPVAVHIASTTYESSWNYHQTFTGGILVNIVGRLYMRFNPAFTVIDSFFVTDTQNFLGDDEDLNAYGYPTTKVQSYGGHDLPIWVNDPAARRYIYGVQGHSAGDFVDFATCDYMFPDGNSCAIDHYEFTDEVLQMIRFDFFIR